MAGGISGLSFYFVALKPYFMRCLAASQFMYQLIFIVIISLFYYYFYPLKSYTHFDLKLSSGNIRALHNGISSSTRVLCLHGWLDNRASFLPMLPYMNSLECVAVDLPGHGESQHRAPASLLHHVDYIRDIKLILDALGWTHCHLIGHSMGAALALISASVMPDRIHSLCMIDSLHPLSRKPRQGPEMLQRSLAQFTQWDQNRKTIFASLDAAVKARLKASPFLQSERSATLIMEYATEKVEQGYRLRSDARLNFRSPLMLCPEQTDAFIKAVRQPVLAILGTDGIVKHRGPVEQTLKLFRAIEHQTISGGHHVHMEQPQRVAQHCLGFIQEHTA